MRRPQHPGAAVLVALVLSLSFTVQAQQLDSPADQTTARGIELYEKGDDAGAVKVLRAVVKQHQDDLGAWYYLGLALERQKKAGDARKAYEKAARLGDDLLSVQFDPSTVGRSPKSLKPFHPQLRQAAESAAKYIQLAKPSKSKIEEWTSRAAYLHDLAELSSPNNSDPALRDVLSTREVTTRPRILAKPEARYTEEARKHMISGTVVLRCIFAADGRVRAVYPVKSLPRGLTLAAITVAQQIKFVPATKDSHPVSVFMQVEYNFNIY